MPSPTSPSAQTASPEPTRWTKPCTPASLTLLALAALTLATLPALRQHHFFTVSDSPHYLALAQGQPAMLPFASRQLAPLLVRLLTRTGLLTLHHAFVLQGLIALLVFLAATLRLTLRPRPSLWLAAVFLPAFWAQQFSRLVLPDLLFAALLSLLLLALASDHIFLATLLLFPLELTRESTPLVLLCLLAALWPRLRWLHVLSALASTALGALLVHHLTRNALPNREGLSAGLYLLGKVPWNLARNLLGLRLWTNVADNCAIPAVQLPLHLGSRITAVGLCHTEWHHPVATASALLASFGLLPLLYLHTRRTLPSASTPLLRFCLFYGLISFLSAPLLGESILRLTWYSWPLWLVALPILLAHSPATFTSRAATLAFLTLHLLLTWSTFLFPDLITLLIALPATLLAQYLLKTSWTGTHAPQT